MIAQTATVAAVALSAVAPARADVIGFYDGTDLVAQLTTSGNTDFRLDFVYAPATAGTAFINDILLGYSGAPSDLVFWQNLAGDTAGNVVNACLTGPGCSAEGTGAEVKVSWDTSNSAARFNEGEFSMFRIGVTDPSAWDFSRLHINAFLNGNSIKLTGSECTNGQCTPGNNVPEPGSLALFSLALLGAGAATRRRAK